MKRTIAALALAATAAAFSPAPALAEGEIIKVRIMSSDLAATSARSSRASS